MISMGTVWDRTTEFLSGRLGSIMPIALLTIFVPAVIAGNFADLRQGAAPTPAMALGVGSLLLALVTFWGQLALTALALDPSNGRSALGVAARRLPAGLLVMIVMLIAAMVAILPVGMILATSGADLAVMTSGATPALPAGTSIGVAIYLLVLLPVALWLIARLAVTLPALVGERLGLGAILRSWQVTRGVALKIVGVILLYAIVSNVANLAARTAFGAVMFLIAGGDDDGLSLATVLTTIVGGAVSAAFTVLGTVFTAKLFIALLSRGEAAQSQ